MKEENSDDDAAASASASQRDDVTSSVNVEVYDEAAVAASKVEYERLCQRAFERWAHSRTRGGGGSGGGGSSTAATAAQKDPRRHGTTTPSADDTQTSSPATPRTARGRPRTPTWSSRSSGPPWRARPFPLHVIACISEHVLTQPRTRTISRPSSCDAVKPSSLKPQRRCAAPVSLRTRGIRAGSEGLVSARCGWSSAPCCAP